MKRFNPPTEDKLRGSVLERFTLLDVDTDF